MPEERNWQLIDIVIPQNYNIISKDNEKINKYIDLAVVIRTERKVKTSYSACNRALGSFFKQPKTDINVIVGIPNIIVSAQISNIASTARILKDVSKIRVWSETHLTLT